MLHVWLSTFPFQGGLVKAGLDVAQLWLDGDETLVYTIDREGVASPINMIDGHAVTHDPLVVLVSIYISWLGDPLMLGSKHLTFGSVYVHP